MKSLREKFNRDIPYPLPVDTALPPFSTKVNLAHAVIERGLADTELAVKKIFTTYQNLDATCEWATIKGRKKALGQQILNSDKAVREDQESCLRFLEKIRESVEAKKNLEADILKTKNEILEYKDVAIEMEKFVDEYSVYEKFLRKVTQVSDEFKSVGDILNRYETLEHTRRECGRWLRKGLGENARLRKEMAVLVEEKSDRLRLLSNRLVLMEERRKRARETLQHWQSTLQRITAALQGLQEDRASLQVACWDLYCQMCRRRAEPISAAQGDVSAQTNYIMNTIVFYKEVLTIATSVKYSLQSLEINALQEGVTVK